MNRVKKQRTCVFVLIRPPPLCHANHTNSPAPWLLLLPQVGAALADLVALNEEAAARLLLMYVV